MGAVLSHDLSQGTNQFLTFSLDGQEFAIDILQVQEIRNFTKITPIPNSPAEVKGVINLRGTVVPVIDLRTALGFNAAQEFQFAAIIVANIESKVIGFIVDTVSDVIDLKPEDIELPPTFAIQKETQVIQGIAKSEDRLISLLDVGHFVHSNIEISSNSDLSE